MSQNQKVFVLANKQVITGGLPLPDLMNAMARLALCNAGVEVVVPFEIAGQKCQIGVIGFKRYGGGMEGPWGLIVSSCDSQHVEYPTHFFYYPSAIRNRVTYDHQGRVEVGPAE